jgi:hypothetical protein
MKKYLILILLTISFVQTNGQSLFFDNIKNSTWTASPALDEKKLQRTTPLHLNKFRTSKDSLKVNSTIWLFSDQLYISRYDVVNKTEDSVATLKYSTDPNKTYLTIILSDGQILKFDVGITSDGYNVMLLKQKKSKQTR